MERIAVIGAGMMGPGIAQVFAARGHSVRVRDTAAEKLGAVGERVRANLARMAEYDLVEGGEIPGIRAGVGGTSDLGAACNSAGVVAEAITENRALKQALFAELAGICPAATIL